jgi:delta-lactam-biosynthetic de-N-acetylase
MYKKRRRRRKNDKLRIIIYMIPLLCVIVAGIGVVRAFTTDGNKIQQEEPGAEKLSPNSEKDISNDTPTEEDETDGTLTDVKQDDTNSPSTEQHDSKNTDDEDEQTDDAKEFTLADLDNPQGFDERPTEHGIVLENEQIDLSGLDTTCLDWGQGGDLDEYNRPAGCMQYQEKYGMYNAYFIKDEPEKKVIYLTMDEGYEYGCSSRILDTLKEKNVHAVFFVTKSYAEQNPDLVRRMIDEGHEVGNHSVTHPAAGLPSQDIETQTNEINENHRYIKEQFGYDMHLFRYPAGKFSQQSIALINNLNYKSVFWSFAYLDYDVENQPDPAESLQKIMSKLHPGAIYLLHAESETNTQILGDFIDQARAQGYEFKVFQ